MVFMERSLPRAIFAFVIAAIVPCEMHGAVDGTETSSVGTGIFQTPWQDETQYIVEQVGSDLVEMAVFLKHHHALSGIPLPVVAVETDDGAATAGSNAVVTYRLTVDLGPDGKTACDLQLGTGVWLPGNYAPLTRAVFHQLGLVPPAQSAVAASDLLDRLTTPLTRS
jgi:hypothetical protein